MSGTDQNADEKKFNDTVKRMLKTPPKPHDASSRKEDSRKPQSEEGSERKS